MEHGARYVNGIHKLTRVCGARVARGANGVGGGGARTGVVVREESRCTDVRTSHFTGRRQRIKAKARSTMATKKRSASEMEAESEQLLKRSNLGIKAGEVQALSDAVLKKHREDPTYFAKYVWVPMQVCEEIDGDFAEDADGMQEGTGVVVMERKEFEETVQRYTQSNQMGPHHWLVMDTDTMEKEGGQVLQQVAKTFAKRHPFHDFGTFHVKDADRKLYGPRSLAVFVMRTPARVYEDDDE